MVEKKKPECFGNMDFYAKLPCNKCDEIEDCWAETFNYVYIDDVKPELKKWLNKY